MTSVPRHNNPNNTLALLDQFFLNKKNTTCSRYKRVVPNLTPFISGLSIYSAKSNTYVLVYVYGGNFFSNGTTTVNFGNIKNLAINFLSQSSFFFQLPVSSIAGNYNITVENNIFLNGTTVVSNTGNGLTLVSNSIKFTIIKS
jgi:hypothetical protein